MTEKEYKVLLPARIYNDLSNRISWDERIVQVNFYYSNGFIQKWQQGVKIRVRCTDKRIFLQVKVKMKHDDLFWISQEYELQINNIPDCISEEQIKQVWSQYVYGDVSLQGYLVTERLTKKIDKAELMLDRNSYNKVVDYELEVECHSIDYAKQLVQAIGLTSTLQPSFSKYARFCQTLRHD